MLDFLNNLWGLGTEYRNRVIVPARQATKDGGIDSLQSSPGLHKRLKIRAQATKADGIDSLQSILGF